MAWTCSRWKDSVRTVSQQFFYVNGRSIRRHSWIYRVFEFLWIGSVRSRYSNMFLSLSTGQCEIEWILISLLETESVLQLYIKRVEDEYFWSTWNDRSASHPKGSCMGTVIKGTTWKLAPLAAWHTWPSQLHTGCYSFYLTQSYWSLLSQKCYCLLRGLNTDFLHAWVDMHQSG